MLSALFVVAVVCFVGALLAWREETHFQEVERNQEIIMAQNQTIETAVASNGTAIAQIGTDLDTLFQTIEDEHAQADKELAAIGDNFASGEVSTNDLLKQTENLQAIHARILEAVQNVRGIVKDALPAPAPAPTPAPATSGPVGTATPDTSASGTPVVTAPVTVVAEPSQTAPADGTTSAPATPSTGSTSA